MHNQPPTYLSKPASSTASHKKQVHRQYPIASDTSDGSRQAATAPPPTRLRSCSLSNPLHDGSPCQRHWQQRAQIEPRIHIVQVARLPKVPRVNRTPHDRSASPDWLLRQYIAATVAGSPVMHCAVASNCRSRVLDTQPAVAPEERSAGPAAMAVAYITMCGHRARCRLCRSIRTPSRATRAVATRSKHRSAAAVLDIRQT